MLQPPHLPPLAPPCSEGKRHSPAPGCNLGGAERGETFLAGTPRQAPLRATAGLSGGNEGITVADGRHKATGGHRSPIMWRQCNFSCRKVALQLHFMPITSAATGSLRRRLGNLARPTRQPPIGNNFLHEFMTDWPLLERLEVTGQQEPLKKQTLKKTMDRKMAGILDSIAWSFSERRPD